MMYKKTITKQLESIQEHCKNDGDKAALTIAIAAMESCQDIDIGRHAEICKAEAEGRLVVLPCKVGSTGWQITECFDGDRGCQGNCDECPKKKTIVSFRFISKAHIVRHIEKDEFGKTVFLTREAAEKALDDTYPCTDHECYDRGNYHVGCGSCSKHKGGGQE